MAVNKTMSSHLYHGSTNERLSLVSKRDVITFTDTGTRHYLLQWAETRIILALERAIILLPNMLSRRSVIVARSLFWYRHHSPRSDTCRSDLGSSCLCRQVLWRVSRAVTMSSMYTPCCLRLCAVRRGILEMTPATSLVTWRWNTLMARILPAHGCRGTHIEPVSSGRGLGTNISLRTLLLLASFHHLHWTSVSRIIPLTLHTLFIIIHHLQSSSIIFSPHTPISASRIIDIQQLSSRQSHQHHHNVRSQAQGIE